MKQTVILLLFTFGQIQGQLLYVNSAVYKFIVGFTMPINVEAPGRSLGLLSNLQGLYRQPDNITYFLPYKVVQKRSISKVFSRNLIYKALENVLDGEEKEGRKCLVRLICGVAAADLSLGVDHPELANLLHILFTPFENNFIEEDYVNAYYKGMQGNIQCENYYNCSMSTIINKFRTFFG